MEIKISDNMVKKILVKQGLPVNSSPQERRETLKDNLQSLPANEKLYFLRKNMGLTQAQMGQHFGVDGSAISLMEDGTRKLNFPAQEFIKKEMGQ